MIALPRFPLTLFVAAFTVLACSGTSDAPWQPVRAMVAASDISEKPSMTSRSIVNG